MKSSYAIFGSVLLLLLLFGCNAIKETTYLPAVNKTMDSDSFSQTLDISSMETVELSGVYAIITTDNVQIQQLKHKANFNDVWLGSEITFLGKQWEITVFDSGKKKIGITNADSVLTLVDGSKIGKYKVSLSFNGDRLNAIELTLSRALSITEGELLDIPNSSGYSLLYVGKGVFQLG